MRIAIDARSLEGGRTGVGRYLENILKCWSARKDVEFVLYFKDAVPADGFLREGNFVLRRLRNPLGFSSNFFFQHVLLPRHIRNDRADFFFSPFYLRPLFCPARSAITLHDISYEAHPEWFDRRSQFVLRTLSRLSAHKADLIFTVSEFSKSEIRKFYGTPEEKIVVTPLAPDGDFRAAAGAEKIAEVKDRYHLGRYLLSVGTLFSRRHAAEIIEAFSRYAAEGSDCQLCFVGKDRTFPAMDIDRRIGEANARLGAGRIVRLDFSPEEELTALYGGAEAVIYLSDYEGFGLPVVEAQFFGKPVITSAGSSLSEVGAQTVECVSRNDVPGISASLRRVLDDGGYRAALAERGRENLRRFSWQACAARTLEEILKIN